MRTKKRKTPINKTTHGKILHNNQKGWKVINIYGSPYDRGYAHGYLLYDDLAKIIKTYPFILSVDAAPDTFESYLKIARTILQPIIKDKFPEIYEELEGIVAGATAHGTIVNMDFLIAWNAYMSLYSFKLPGRCSTFIATGNATEKGHIVMAHTTHTAFTDAQFYNIVLFMTPQKGHPFVMQTAAGLVASVTDWFICSTGIIGCESTISETNYSPEFGYPFFCRIRTAMQYGTSLDDYVKIMKDHNAGDYPCSWLFGDINTNEIMLFEIGLHKINEQRTKNGVFYGMNSAIDHELRTAETTDDEWNDIETSTGARALRFNQLLYDKYTGRINTKNAKKILADHYDVFLHKDDPNTRSICNHYENNTELRGSLYHYPFGCTDGKVTDSTLARKLKFFGRFGSACGRKFSIKKHVKKYPKYKSWEPYVSDFTSYPWTLL
jgi:hypothetical protein